MSSIATNPKKEAGNIPRLQSAMTVNLKVRLVSQYFLVASGVRLVDDEAEHLALLHVVKTHDADVALRIFLAASLNFNHDFLDAASTK